MQPRRGQILDLIDWYGRQLQQLGVEVRFNTFVDGADTREFGADFVIVATGSLPRETGFQKALPHVETLPGIETGHVWAVEDVMQRNARLGKRVVLLDEGGNMRGCGTAWKIAEDGHEVTLVTPDPLVGKELQRTAADYPLRQRLAQLRVRFVLESAITHWSKEGATVLSFLDGSEQQIPADSLVLATTNMAEDTVARELEGTGVAFRNIGDSAAPRQAPFVISEGRKVALVL
jgi:pyruvate/2-oxoglutarate dehydrogenase complex dihydrolipoamide dehydrogenase (E3) component